MLAPSAKMLYRASLCLPAAALLAAFAPQAGALAALIAALFLLAACVDALRSAGIWDGAKITAAPLIRQFAGREGAVEIAIEPGAASRSSFRAALASEAGAGIVEKPLEIAAHAAAPASGSMKISIPCRPPARGNFRATCAACETESRWGFWTVSRRFPLASEIRVYPDLAAERSEAPDVFISRAGHGERSRPLAGKGREFEKLREYVPGDDVGDIHWKATAKRRFPVTKVYQIERLRDVVVVVDASRLSGITAPLGGTAAKRQTMLDTRIRAALAFALAAEKSGDRFGLALFGRGVLAFIPPGSGKHHFDACRNALYAARAEPVSPDFRELFAFLASRVRKRSLMIFLTDISSEALSARFLENAKAATRHLLAAPLFAGDGVRPATDSANFSTPAADPAVSPAASPASAPADPYAAYAGHIKWLELKTLENKLRAAGIRTAIAPAGKPLAAMLGLYRGAKERQLL